LTRQKPDYFRLPNRRLNGYLGASFDRDEQIEGYVVILGG